MQECEGRGPPGNVAVPSGVVFRTASKDRACSGHGLSTFTGRS